MSKLTLAGVSLSIFLLPLAPALRAQTVAVAEVSGTVSDPSGSAVAGAAITMTETEKHTVRSTVTDAQGNYTLPDLPVGPYSLDVRANGFRNHVESGLVLEVGNNIQINVRLEVGSVNETVEVQANASLVETRENSVSSVVDQQRIQDLPLDGRQATQLIITLGAAVYGDSGDTGSKTFWDSTRISVAGGQGNGTAYLLDGGDNTDPMSNVNMPFPFPDALQEFSVDTSAVSSRFGEHPGATVNAVTKSGSNQLHGDFFEYLRNGDMDARNFFAKAHDTLKRNQFGGTGGGKIITDKLFFFCGYQGTRNRSNPPQSIAYIPTEASLNGDFSTLAGAGCQSSGKALTLKDPSGNPYPGNQLPMSAINPIATTIAQKYLPISSANQCGEVTFGIPVTGDEDQIVGRVDWIQNAKHTLFGRYLFDDYSNPPTFNGSNLLTTTAPGNLERAQSATIGDTYTFGPTTLNSFHVSFNRVRDDRGPTDIPISPTMLGSDMYSAVPNFLLLTISNAFSTFCGTCAPGHFDVNSYQLADDVDLVRGRHQIALGFNLIRIQNNTLSGFDENGTFTFDGSFSGSPLADFMTGQVSDFQQTNPTPDDLRQWVMSFYAQDSFKVSPRFTFNFGLRWEPTFADPDKYGRGDSFSESAFYANQFSTVHPSAPAGLFFKGDPGIPPAMWNGHLANFAPRVGLVWSPHGDGRDTLRVGAAILYDSTETWFNERETTNPPFGNDIDVGSTGTLSNPWAGYAGGNPFPQAPGQLFFPVGGTYVNMPINPKPTYVAQWNVTYQRQLPGGWLASASYIGNETTHLWITHESDPSEYLGLGACTIAGVTYSTCSTTKNSAQRRILYPVESSTWANTIRVSTPWTTEPWPTTKPCCCRSSTASPEIIRFWPITPTLTAFPTMTSARPLPRRATRSRLTGMPTGGRVSSIRGAFSMPRWWRRAHGKAAYARLASRLLSNLGNSLRSFHVSSGQPLNITTGHDDSLTDLNNDRPNQVLADAYPTTPGCKSAPCYQWINPEAFVPNPTGTFGHVGRNALRGPGTTNVDVALSRIFGISERFHLEARAEAFNIINHPNFVGAISPAGLVAAFTTMNTNLSSSSFGQVQSAFDPRIMQFALKLYF